MNGLQKIDYKILKELLKDGRKSFTTIAKECCTSKDVIWNHYRELKKAGIVIGATIQFNYQKFGYSGVAMIMLSVESQYLAEVLERLKETPDINTFRHYNATHNLAAIAMLKNLRDLERVKEIINKQGKINEIKTYLWMDVRNIPENMVASESEKETEQAQGRSPYSSEEPTKESVKIDEIDMQIVEKLTKNGRLPFSKIGQEIGASTDTISRRYEKLKKNNFIKVSIQINPIELGYQAILDVKVALTDQSKTKEIIEKISKIPGITYLVQISGDYDLSVVALVKDCRDIIGINEEIAKISSIKKIEATLRDLGPRWPGPRQYISTY